MEHLQKTLTCDCGYVAAGDDDALVAQAQSHAWDVHGVDLDAALILILARPAAPPDDDVLAPPR